MANSKQKDFTSASGAKYVFQKVPPVQWLDIMDEVEDGERRGKSRRLYSKVLENIVVSPQMKMEDFEEYAELEEVVTAAIRFQQNK